MAAGEARENSCWFWAIMREIKALQHNKLIGWGLVGIGVWALYDTFISNWLYSLLCNLVVATRYACFIITGIPNVVIAALLIFAGLKLLGLHPERKTATMSFTVSADSYAFHLAGGRWRHSAG